MWIFSLDARASLSPWPWFKYFFDSKDAIAPDHFKFKKHDPILKFIGQTWLSLFSSTRNVGAFHEKTTINFAKIALYKFKNFLLRHWRCGDGSSTGPKSKIELFMKIVYDCEPSITIVTMSSILDVAKSYISRTDQLIQFVQMTFWHYGDNSCSFTIITFGAKIGAMIISDWDNQLKVTIITLISLNSLQVLQILNNLQSIIVYQV